MSVSRPARCLFSNSSIPTMTSRVPCRNFHTTPSLFQRRRPRYPSIKAAEMGLIDKKPPKVPAKELFRPYSEEEKAMLGKKYTPEQIRAIEAGEGAVRPEDLDQQGIIRTDIGSLPYLDDFRHYRSVVDKKPPDNSPIDPNARFMTEDEMSTSFMKYYEKLEKENPTPKSNGEIPDLDAFDPTRLNFWRADYESPRYMGTNGPIPSGPNLFAPAIPKTISLDGTPVVSADGKDAEKDVKKGSEKDARDNVDPRDPDGVYDRLRKQTGLTLKDIFNLNVKILVQHQVTNMTRLGRVRSLYCFAIAGNRNGQLGIGQAKGQQPANTMILAKIAAIRNMKPIPRYEERTIYGDVESKVSAVKVELMSRPPGFGLRCQHLIFEMARAAGIHDLAARVPRSRNKMNTVKAAYNALMKQRIPDEVARGRGKKLVDVRKVYYSGAS